MKLIIRMKNNNRRINMVSVIENRKRNVLIWLDALNPDTKHLTGVGLKYGISKSRVAQVRDKVWRWIRHPGYCFTPEIRQLTHTRPKRLPEKIGTEIVDFFFRA